MAKVFHRSRRSAEQILVRAAKLEALAEHPGNRDDPNWLRRRVERMRVYAHKRQDARDRKLEERQKNA